MEDDSSTGEDEWSLIQTRFGKEGYNWESTAPNQKSLQLFRWLVDAEDNLKASRNINDKLRKQHEEEKKEWDRFCLHLRQKCESRVKEIEVEANDLKEDLNALLSSTQAISNIFRQEGLEDISRNPSRDQIADLLLKRSQMMEDLRKRKPHNGKSSPTASINLENLPKIKTEREILKTKNEELKKKTEEMSKRISYLEKSLKEFEEHNENLSYKLSETLVEIEEKERLLTHFEKGGLKLAMKEDEASEPCSLIYGASKTGREARNINQTFRQKSSLFFKRGNSLQSRGNGGRDSPPMKLNSLFDSQILNSKSHLTHLNDVKKLQNEVERLKINNSKSGKKYGELFKQYESLNLKSENQVEMALQEQEWKVEKLTREMEIIKEKLKIMEENKRQEDNLRNLMEKDLKQLRNERIEHVTKESEIINEMKKTLEENMILKEKIKCFETENKNLNENLDKYLIEKNRTDSQEIEINFGPKSE